MYVLTIDQRDSRHHADLVPDLLTALAPVDVVRPFARTAGDEVQAVLAEPAAVLEAVLIATRHGTWSCGIGCGAVTVPLPEETRAGSGPAFEAARTAVDRAKSSPQHAAVVSARGPSDAAADAEAVLALLVLLRQRRTPAGWEVVTAMSRGGTQRVRAAELGISPQAFSQRLASAAWRQELAARPAVEHLLARAGEAS